MSDLHTVLVVPLNPSQPMEMSQSELPVDVEAMLNSRGASGRFVAFNVIGGEAEGSRVGFLMGVTPDLNHRAQDILAYLTDVYMEIPGTAAFVDLSHEKIIGVLRQFK